MALYEISLIASQIRKWDLEIQKIRMNNFFLVTNENGQRELEFDVTMLNPAEMTEEFVGKLKYEFSKVMSQENGDDNPEVELESESFIRQKLHGYFKRILMELNNPRRKRGQPRMIYSTYLDIYSESQDISFLPPKVQFYVLFNWAKKYYEKEEYNKAIEPLRKLLKINPEFGLGYKWLARSLKKNRKYDEAMYFYEKYAEVDGSIDSLLDLAKSYRKGKLFEKSEKLYHQILEKDPGNMEARIGLAQIKYARKEPDYIEILDELFKEDPDWLREWLVDEFNFRIYLPEKTYLSPVQASKFLGYKKVFELTQKAFKNDLPSHFNPVKARLSFYKEELENWAHVMNRFQCLPEEVKLYPEALEEEISADRLAQANTPQISTTDENGEETINGRPLTRVEKILLEIRRRKAMRLAAYQQNQNNEFQKTDESEKVAADNSETIQVESQISNVPAEATVEPPKKKRGRPRKKNVQENSESQAASDAIAQEATTPRKRGRKKKTTEPENSTAKTGADSNETSQPEGSATSNTTSESSAPRKRGRPRKKKTDGGTEPPADDSESDVVVAIESTEKGEV